jgi:hypothetical protein
VLKPPFNNSAPLAPALCLPAPPPLRTHSNARKPIPFIGLLHSSLHTPVWGSSLAINRRPSFAPIPFRITFFAHPHHLTLIESYSCKNIGGRGWWDRQAWLSFYALSVKLQSTRTEHRPRDTGHESFASFATRLLAERDSMTTRIPYLGRSVIDASGTTG